MKTFQKKIKNHLTLENQKSFNLFERDKKPIQETLASESDLFIDDIPDLFSGLFNKGNNLNNTRTFPKPEEEIQALLEEIFKGNSWDHELLSQPQASITQQEVPPLFIQEFKQNSNINPQNPHFQVEIHEASNFKVTFSKEMDKKLFEAILKKEDDENQPSANFEQTFQDQLTSKEKEIIRLYDSLFDMSSQKIETTNLAQRLEFNSSQIPQENTIPPGQMPKILHYSPSIQPIHISRERKVSRKTKNQKILYQKSK
ncbi:hypothetical protein O181_128436 [Austropuccinia psidii MF-1]|uniref:Uncharacterized protein n=1 Tax=Austropuccinia psidii MF-1 TaxID=1389203 RepID=A0A9Q3KY32_9BASI|nr:hypothetical protein [Austropuccinia psidii MF-1]